MEINKIIFVQNRTKRKKFLKEKSSYINFYEIRLFKAKKRKKLYDAMKYEDYCLNYARDNL